MRFGYEMSNEEENQYLLEHMKLNEKIKSLSNDERIRQKRTLNTALVIAKHLKPISWDMLTAAGYLQVDKSVIPFVRRYEYQIEGAKLQPTRFIENLHSFYQKMAVEIKKNNGMELFMEFYHAWDERLMSADLDNMPLLMVGCCYMDILIQQMEYLTDVLGEMVCGITTGGKIISCQDIFPLVDLPNYNITERPLRLKNGEIIVVDSAMRDCGLESMCKEYAKYGYHVTSVMDMQILQTTSQAWTNTISSMVFFINEYTLDMFQSEAFCFTEDFAVPRQWKPTELYKKELKQRKYLLPSNGVYAEYYNAKSIKSVKYKEVVRNDTVYLLYRADTDNGQISGYYNTKTDAFFSLFGKSTQEEIGKQFENFILENYYRLTVRDIDYSRKKLSCMMIVNDLKDAEKKGYTQNQPIAKMFFQGGKQKNYLSNGDAKENNFLLNGAKIKKTKEREKSYKSVNGYIRNLPLGQTTSYEASYKPYNRENYRQEVKSVNGYIRNLPLGQTASYEAVSYAASLGIVLDKNETYVKPFIKTVLKIK